MVEKLLSASLGCFQAKPAECFSAVEKLLMACCTMQPEDGALPRGDAEGDGEVYHKNDEESSVAGNAVPGFGGMVSFKKLLNRFHSQEAATKFADLCDNYVGNFYFQCRSVGNIQVLY